MKIIHRIFGDPHSVISVHVGFPDGSVGKESTCNARDTRDLGSVGWKDPLEQEKGNSLQYSCLKNPIDRGAW